MSSGSEPRPGSSSESVGGTTPPAGPSPEVKSGAGGAGGAGTTSAGSGRRAGSKGREQAPNMLPGRRRRPLAVERILTRLIATAGIVGIGVAIAAIMVSSNSKGWIVGLVVSLVTVVLSAILWSSRQL
ncbi:MAG TPA: hypothetical protein VGI87_13115 [Solirubrobacteraceae bacterium]